MEFKGKGKYGVSVSEDDDYFTELDVNCEDEYHMLLDEMRGIFGDDVNLIWMEA